MHVQSLPPLTKSLLGGSGTVVLPNHGSGMSLPSLTQELVIRKKACTAEETMPSLCPPTASRLPLRLAAADTLIGVSGRTFQIDVWLAE